MDYIRHDEADMYMSMHSIDPVFWLQSRGSSYTNGVTYYQMSANVSNIVWSSTPQICINVSSPRWRKLICFVNERAQRLIMGSSSNCWDSIQVKKRSTLTRRTEKQNFVRWLKPIAHRQRSVPEGFEIRAKMGVHIREQKDISPHKRICGYVTEIWNYWHHLGWRACLGDELM